MEKTLIKVEVQINAPIEKIWDCWINPSHIVNWYNASDDWCAPKAENDLRVGGKFLTHMEAKDGSFGFDFEGIYNTVGLYKKIEYIITDGRKVIIEFEKQKEGYLITEIFEAEEINPIEIQQTGWQAILNNFKKYVE